MPAHRREIYRALRAIQRNGGTVPAHLATDPAMREVVQTILRAIHRGDLQPTPPAFGCADLVRLLRQHGVERVVWTIYEDDDETHWAEARCYGGAEQPVAIDPALAQALEEPLWDLSCHFLEDSGQFELDIVAEVAYRRAFAQRVGDVIKLYPFEHPEAVTVALVAGEPDRR